MKRILIIIILILLSCKIIGSSGIMKQIKIESRDEKVYDYILGYYDINKRVTGIVATNYAKRFTECYIKYSDKYNIPLWYIVKQGKGESGFYPFAKGDWNGKYYESLGAHQIKPKYFRHLLYYIDNGNLAEHIRKKNIKNTNRYFLRIGYNIEMAAIIISSNYKKYKDWKLTFLRYGLRTDTFNEVKNDKSKWLEYSYMENIFSD